MRRFSVQPNVSSKVSSEMIDNNNNNKNNNSKNNNSKNKSIMLKDLSSNIGTPSKPPNTPSHIISKKQYMKQMTYHPYYPLDYWCIFFLGLV